MMRLIHVIADAQDSDAGFVGERLLGAHGAELVLHDRDRLPASLSAEADLVLLLGSARSVCDPAQARVVAAESALVRGALASHMPVLGICYGGQLLAHALGGRVAVAVQPEIGWFTLDSFDRVLCPPGPWTQFHSDAFSAPPGSRVLGESAAGCQGFSHENGHGARALGWQFHPEVTSDRFDDWIDRLRGFCRTHGVDPDQIRSDRPDEGQLRRAAHDLVDAAVRWLEGSRDQDREQLKRSADPTEEVHP